MHRVWRTLAVVAVLGLALLVAPASAGWAADPTPSPTLGSTNSPAPNPPGAADSDPSDFNGAILVVIGAAIVALVVGGGTLLLNRSRRLDISQKSTPEDERPAVPEHEEPPTDRRP